jgi:hypothetical protein
MVADKSVSLRLLKLVTCYIAKATMAWAANRWSCDKPYAHVLSSPLQRWWPLTGGATENKEDLNFYTQVIAFVKN